jgi:hypothetical protein
MTDYNLTMKPTAIPSAATQVQNSAPGAMPTTKVVTRNIAPLTTYNNETGLLDSKPWAEETTTEPTTKEEPAKPNRHDDWKTQQAAKKQELADKKAEKLAKNQVLAKDMLAKGDFAGAAKALGMTFDELRTYTQSALLGIPTEKKELTPEEKRAADEEKFKADRLAFEKEQTEFRYQQIATAYIDKNITPILKDSEKYEFINNADVDKIKAYMYNYMNEHFAKTKQELKAEDVADVIEKQLYDNFVAGLEKGRTLKKVSKYFAPKEEAIAEEETSMEQAEKALPTKERKIDLSTPNVREEDPEEEEINERFPAETKKQIPKQAVIRKGASESNVPFALLSAEEKWEIIKREKEQEARARR